MITAFLIAAAVVLWIAGIFVLLAVSVELMDSRPRRISGWLTLAALLLWITGGLAVVIHQTTQDDAKGPCLHEETNYVLVGKVMTPYTVCTERGTWKKAKQ